MVAEILEAAAGWNFFERRKTISPQKVRRGGCAQAPAGIGGAVRDAYPTPQIRDIHVRSPLRCRQNNRLNPLVAAFHRNQAKRHGFRRNVAPGVFAPSLK
jgi:hypothetical protein